MVKQVKATASTSLEFSKRLAGMAVALSLFGLGVFAAYQPHVKQFLFIYAVALTFAGAVNVIGGSVVLYRVLMHKEG